MTTDDILAALSGIAERNPNEARIVDLLKIEVMNRRTRTLSCEAALHDTLKRLESMGVL